MDNNHKGVIATISGSLALKITSIVAAVIIVSAVGFGIYLAIMMTVFAKVTVPSVLEMKEPQAKKILADSELTIASSYPYSVKTGNEKVTAQKPKKEKEVDKGTTITVTLEDKEVVDAWDKAATKVGEANSKLAELRRLPIQSTDLDQPMRNAQDRLNNATSIDMLTSPNDSCLAWAEMVVNECNNRAAAYQAEQARIAQQQERARQVEASKRTMYDYMRSITGAPIGTKLVLWKYWMSEDCTQASALCGFRSNPYAADPAWLQLNRTEGSWKVTDFSVAGEIPLNIPGTPESPGPNDYVVY